jgi:predicted nucleic acid-binding protein
MIVVADSGPLHYLILVGEVDLLRTLYGNIIIPPAVVRELTTSGAPSQVAEWMRHPPDWLRIDVIERDTALISSIDAGETAAMSLALAIAADPYVSG